MRQQTAALLRACLAAATELLCMHNTATGRRGCGQLEGSTTVQASLPGGAVIMHDDPQQGLQILTAARRQACVRWLLDWMWQLMLA